MAKSESSVFVVPIALPSLHRKAAMQPSVQYPQTETAAEESNAPSQSSDGYCSEPT